MRKQKPMFYSALLLTGVNLLLRMVSTSFQVYVSGRIGAAGVGLLQLVMSVGALAMTAGIAGVRTAAMYLTAEELGRKKPGTVKWVLSACFTYSILCSGLVAGLLYGFAPDISARWLGDPETVGALRLFACFLPVSCLCGVMTGYFTAANRIGALAAVEVAEQLCSMAVTASLLAFWAGTDAARACEAVVLGAGAGACLTLVCLVLLRLRERPPYSGPIPVRSRLLHMALPLACADILKSGITTTENLMVPKRLALYPGTADPLSAFGTVCGMVFPVLMFPASVLFGLCELLIPELARCSAAGSSRRIRYLVTRSLRLGILYGSLFCGLIILLAEPLCQTLYGSREAGAQLQLYGILIPVLYCDTLTDAMTKGLGQQKACVRYNILTSFWDVVLLFLVLPRYGMAGYFFSFAVTHLLNFVLSLRRLLKISGCRIQKKTPLLCAAAVGFGIVVCSRVSAPALRAGSFVIILICLLFLLRVLRREDIIWIRGLILQK